MTLRILLPILASLVVALGAVAAAAPAPKKVAGPNGGRIIHVNGQQVEFLVMPERRVQITFLDKAGKAVAPGDQVVTVTTGERSRPTSLTFSKSGTTLVSNLAIPAGEAVPTVVQIRPNASAAAILDRFNVDLSICPTCRYAEYACICDEDDDK